MMDEFIPYVSDEQFTVIESYKCGEDHIKIRLRDGKVYKFSYRSAGQQRVETLKNLAQLGCGLTAYFDRMRKKFF